MIAQLTGTSVGRSFYRRTATCKAPRKRSFLVQVSSRSPRSIGALGAVGGGDGPKGPRDGPVCCWNNDDNSGDDNQGIVAKQGLLACVAAAGLAVSVAMPSPATAADVTGVPAEFMHINMSAYDSSEHDEYFCSTAFLTEDEKELMAPKQYRVREWVYVH